MKIEIILSPAPLGWLTSESELTRWADFVRANIGESLGLEPSEYDVDSNFRADCDRIITDDCDLKSAAQWGLEKLGAQWMGF